MGTSLRLSLVALAMAVLLVTAWLALFDDPPAPLHEAAEPTHARSSPPPEAPSPVPAQGLAPARETLAAPLEPDGNVDSVLQRPGRATVRGRCLDADTQEPLLGCEIVVVGLPSTTSTSADGGFALDYDCPLPVSRRLEVRREGCRLAQSRFEGIPGHDYDLGTLAIRARVVRAQVRDASGTPVEGVTVRLRGTGARAATSDTQGAFVMAGVEVGTWPIEVSEPYALNEPRKVTITAGALSVDLALLVNVMRHIAGVVEDDLGKPVPDAAIGLRPVLPTSVTNQPIPFSSRGETDGQGRFVIVAEDWEFERVQLRVESPKGYEPLDEERGFAWGTTGIRLVVRRATVTLELTVREAGPGPPVERYAVMCCARAARWSSERKLRCRGLHQDGKLCIEGLPRGANLLRVVPDDESLAVSELVEFQVSDRGTPPLVVAIERMRPLTVQVIRRNATPVVGTCVQVVVARGVEVGFASVDDPREGEISTGQPQPELVSSAHTDERGRASLHGSAATTLVLRAMGPGHLPALLSGVRAGGEQPIVIEVAGGGSLRGKLSGEAARAFDCTLNLRPLHGTGEQEVQVKRDRTFAVDDLEPGTYEVVLVVPVKRDDHGASYTPLLPPLAQVVIEADKETVVELDTSAFAPASLDAQLEFDRARLATASITLDGRSATEASPSWLRWRSRWQREHLELDTRGALATRLLPPGLYRFILRWPDSIVVGAPFTLAPGQHLTRTFELAHTRLRIRLLTSAGAPVAKADCRLAPLDDVEDLLTLDLELQTDADGWLVLDPAPQVPVKIAVHGKGKVIVQPQDSAEAAVEVRLQD